MSTEALLVEIGTEELPPKALKKLGQSFSTSLHQLLIKENFSPESFEWFASPRRLAVLVSRVALKQPDTEVEVRGPAVNVAFDGEGNPTKAALGWARGNGIEISEAQRLVTEKGEWLLHKKHQIGMLLQDKIQSLVEQALSGLPIPKAMRWGNTQHQFIRPVHTLCIMLGSAPIKAKLFGVESTNTLRGHRFHGNTEFDLTHANEYENTLLNHYVVASYTRRVDTIRSALDKQAAELGLAADYDSDLLEEIASLVEWPKIMRAEFEQQFLEVPKEALIYTMKDDQKYVPLLKGDGTLSNAFLFVSNIDSKSPEKVIKGNEKVIRPRLADAEFFYNTDKKSTLASRVDSLDSVVFQKQLGTLKNKATRIQTIAKEIALLIQAEEVLAARAGYLCKADLMTNMVMEFPDVQGVMGSYYARNDNEDDSVCNAIHEHYLPRFAGDKVAKSPVSICVSLADKLDTLVGIFSIGQKPKGDKDPFALRRAAIGLIRTINENALDLDLKDLIDITVNAYGNHVSVNQNCHQDVIEFILSRFGALLQDEGVQKEIIHSVSVLQPTAPYDFLNRVHAVDQFMKLDASAALAAANKRVANILAKQNITEHFEVNVSLLKLSQEQALYKAIEKIHQDAGDREFTHKDNLTVLSTLREPVDNFFDSVMVMDEDKQLRENRLALLQSLRALFLSTADISHLAAV